MKRSTHTERPELDHEKFAICKYWIRMVIAKHKLQADSKRNEDEAKRKKNWKQENRLLRPNSNGLVLKMTGISHSIQFFFLFNLLFCIHSQREEKVHGKNERIPCIRLRSAKWCVAFWCETQQTNRVTRLVFRSASRRLLATAVVSCTINKLNITKNTPDFTAGVEQKRLDAQTRGKKREKKQQPTTNIWLYA